MTFFEKSRELTLGLGALALGLFTALLIVSMVIDAMNGQLDCRLCRIIVANGQQK
jgi:hypothetical protein